MTLYECKYCLYSSSRYPDYKKHLGTNKHKTNAIRNVHTHNTQPTITNHNQSQLPITNHNQSQEYNTTQPIYNIEDTNVKKISNMEKILSKGYNCEVYTCTFCLKDYKFKHGLRRHLKTYCMLIPNNYKSKIIDKHNSNNQTKDKLDVVLYNNNGSKLVNSNNNIYNINNTNNIVNNNLIVNPVGQESIEHIKKERLLEILSSGDNMLKEFCKEIYSVTENLNAYIDIRTKMITFINKDNKLEIETMSRMIQKIVYSHMDRIKSIMRVYREELPDNAVRLFDETINIYNCVINSDNIQDEKLIEEEHNRLNIRLLEDIKSSLMLVKDKCKRVIEDIKD